MQNKGAWKLAWGFGDGISWINYYNRRLLGLLLLLLLFLKKKLMYGWETIIHRFETPKCSVVENTAWACFCFAAVFNVGILGLENSMQQQRFVLIIIENLGIVERGWYRLLQRHQPSLQKLFQIKQILHSPFCKVLHHLPP